MTPYDFFVWGCLIWFFTGVLGVLIYGGVNALIDLRNKWREVK